MIFWLIVTAIIIFALAITLRPYWRKTDVTTPDSTDLNIRLYKHRLAELETDLKNKVLDKNLYEQAVSEAKLQLLSDVPENPESRKIAPRRATPTIIATAILVPALSIGLYMLLGNVGVATGKIDTATSQGSPQIQDMIASLAQRMESQPGDVRGWIMLGRSYAATDKNDEAVYAYEKAYALTPDDPEVLTGLAGTLALSNSSHVQGRSMELLQQALAINPNDMRALWLAGHVAVKLGDSEQAVQYWETLLPLLPPGDETVHIVEQYIARASGQEEVDGEAPAGEDLQNSSGSGGNESGEGSTIR